VSDHGNVPPGNVSAQWGTIDHCYVGGGRSNSHLLGIVSVTKEHMRHVPGGSTQGDWEVVFTQRLNGVPVAHKVFASNEKGRIGKLKRESFAHIGKMKNRSIK